MTLRILALSSAFCVAAAGFAAADGGQRYDFSFLDRDANGLVTLSELEIGIDHGVGEANFPTAILATYDENGDGAISLAEVGGDKALYAPETVEERADG